MVTTCSWQLLVLMAPVAMLVRGCAERSPQGAIGTKQGMPRQQSLLLDPCGWARTTTGRCRTLAWPSCWSPARRSSCFVPGEHGTEGAAERLGHRGAHVGPEVLRTMRPCLGHDIGDPQCFANNLEEMNILGRRTGFDPTLWLNLDPRPQCQHCPHLRFFFWSRGFSPAVVSPASAVETEVEPNDAAWSQKRKAVLDDVPLSIKRQKCEDDPVGAEKLPLVVMPSRFV